MPGHRDEPSETRRVTYGELQDFRSAMETGFTSLRKEIRDSRIEASEAHSRMRADWTELLKASVEHEGRLDRLEETAKEATEERRWFWAQVIGVSAIAAGLFTWAAGFLKGLKP